MQSNTQTKISERSCQFWFTASTTPILNTRHRGQHAALNRWKHIAGSRTFILHAIWVYPGMLV
jgi:hypothetical protein